MYEVASKRIILLFKTAVLVNYLHKMARAPNAQHKISIHERVVNFNYVQNMLK